MDDADRREFVQNDEPLYRWYIDWNRRARHGGLYRFVRENRAEIDNYLKSKGHYTGRYRKG